MQRVFHKDGTLPSEPSIFVFGSNLRGVHGLGAAKVAHEQFGARWGCSIGLMGDSYGIPTKNFKIHPLPFQDVDLYIYNFVHFTIENPYLRFFVTRVGCGLAGFEDRRIAPLFKDAINCSFAEQWKPYLT